MYLSRIWIDPSRRGARRLLASPQRIHAVIASAASQEDPKTRPLWRLDDDSSGLQLLVTSSAKPDFSSLLEQAGMPVEDGWQTTAYEPFLDRLEVGQEWRFRLAANPVRSVREVTDPSSLQRGKRVPVVGARHLQQWLIDRGGKLGFEVNDDSFIVSGRQAENFRRQGREVSGSSQRVVITAVRFDGILRVSDAEAIRKALVEGIGSAKAYGCGLLTLAPL